MNDDGVIDVRPAGEIRPAPHDPPRGHRWSGWPGAWCLDCGQEDQGEICIAEHAVCITCIYDHVMCEEHHPMQRCETHENGPCPRPGQMLADPYALHGARRDLLACLLRRLVSETTAQTEHLLELRPPVIPKLLKTIVKFKPTPGGER